jgi:hypothetical protein
VAQDQRVEFLFAAQVSGQEQLQKLISSVDSLRKETEQLKSANTGLAASTDAVIRNGVRYNNAIDAQSKALRQARQGTQQLGMQINDFATSVSTGASPVQAFNQQIGQVGFALSQMGGKLGVVGGFLAGPWGAAVLVATMVLAPFIENMLGASSAAKELEDSEKKVRDSSIAVMFAKAELDKALGRNTDAYKMASAAAIQAGLDDLNSAKDFLKASVARMAAAKKEAKVLAILSNTGGATGKAASFVAGLFGYGDVETAKKETLDATDALNKETESLLKALASREKALKPSASAKSRTGSRAAASIPAPKMEKVKVKPDFSMLGFYEEFFAKEFEQNDKSLAKVAEDQINSLLSTVPAMAKMSDEMAQIISRNEELNNSFDAIGQSVSNSFKGMLTGAMSFKDAMKGIISAVIDELWKLFVVQQIVGVVKSAMGSVFGVQVPGKAIGGSVGKNRPYMVGEQGPELFIPGGSGTIIPNRNLSSNGGGGNPINISVDARGASDPAAVRAQVQQGIMEAAPAIIAAAESRTVAGLRRPRLGGVMQ